MPGLPFNVMEPIVTLTPAFILPLYWEGYCRISNRRFAVPIEVAISMLRIATIYLPGLTCITWAGWGPLVYQSYALAIACGCASLVFYDWLSHKIHTKLKPAISPGRAS